MEELIQSFKKKSIDYNEKELKRRLKSAEIKEQQTGITGKVFNRKNKIKGTRMN